MFSWTNQQLGHATFARTLAAMDRDSGPTKLQTAPERADAHGERLLPVPRAPAEPEPGLPALPDPEIEAARGFVDASRAASTRKAYRADWDRFCQWCRARQAHFLPASPALLAVYLSFLAASGLAPPSVARALAAIAHAHKRAGQIPPHRGPEGGVVTEALAGIRRSRPDDPGRKHPADADIVRQLLCST